MKKLGLSFFSRLSTVTRFRKCKDNYLFLLCVVKGEWNLLFLRLGDIFRLGDFRTRWKRRIANGRSYLFLEESARES